MGLFDAVGGAFNNAVVSPVKGAYEGIAEELGLRDTTTAAEQRGYDWGSSSSKLRASFTAGEITDKEYRDQLRELSIKYDQSGAYKKEIDRLDLEQKTVADEKESKNFMREMLDLSKTDADRKFNLATDQFQYQKDLAEKSDKQKQDIANEMMEESKITDSQYESEMGKAVTDVKQSFASANNSNIRNARRMGLNPNSGRFNSASKGNLIAEAATTAGARNQTRSGLKAFGENKKDNARRVKLGLNPLALGVNDQRIGLRNGAINGLNQGANFFGNSASRLQGQQNFNTNMNFRLKQWNERERPPSFWQQAAVTAVGGGMKAAGYALGGG